MERPDERPQCVRHDEADEADDPAEGDGRRREDRRRDEHDGRGAVDVNAERRGRLLAERERVEARRERDGHDRAGPDDQSRDEELGRIEDRDPAEKPADHGAQARNHAIARDDQEREERPGERAQHDAAEKNGEHGGAAAEGGEAPGDGDREDRTGERAEGQDERCGRADGDRGDGTQRGAGGCAGNVRIGERVAKQPLEERARDRERAADEGGADDPRQPQVTNDRERPRIAVAADRSEDLAGAERDRADERTDDHAHGHAAEQHSEDHGGPHGAPFTATGTPATTRTTRDACAAIR